MTSFTLSAQVKNGLLPAKDMLLLQNFLEQHNGRWAELTVRVSEKRRSLKQNAFYHGAFIGALHQCFMDTGVRLAHDDIHEGLRDAFAKNARVVEIPGGLTFRLPPSTARLSTQEFEQFLEEIRIYFAERMGWQLPVPNEVPIEVYQPKEEL